MTLPNRSEFEERERTRRLAQFRHELNAIGDSPTIEAVKGVIRRASELRLEEHDVREELLELRACVDGLELQARLGRGELPAADAPDPLAPGDTCHFACPVRFGRRRADQIGHLVLTSGWLKFRGALDVSVAWSEVASVARDGREIVIGLQDSRRILRFACHSIGEAARGGVLASYLARKARMDTRPDPTTSHASW